MKNNRQVKLIQKDIKIIFCLYRSQIFGYEKALCELTLDQKQRVVGSQISENQ